MFAMEGIPAVYFNSMFGTEDDHERYKDTKHKRDLKITYSEKFVKLTQNLRKEISNNRS